MILTNGSELAARLVERLEREGQRCARITEGEPLSAAELSGIDHVVHLWTHEGSTRGYETLVELAQALAGRDSASPVTISIVTHGLHDVLGTGDVDPARALMMGPALVVPQEHTDLAIRTIDIEPMDATNAAVDMLLAELTAGVSDPHVAYRGRARFVPRFEQVALDAAADARATLRDRGVYLITGGFGKVGVHLAEMLFDACGARLVLLGRHPQPSRLRALEERGAEVFAIAGDVSDEARMGDVLQAITDRFGALHGVIHAAGSLDHESFSCPIERVDAAISASQFRPKVTGVEVLSRVLADQPLDFCVLISSNAAVLGGLGFTAYAAANRYMDAFAARINRTSRTPWLSTNWDTWAFDGASGAEFSMTPAESREAFRRILARMPAPQLVVATGDVARRFDQWVGRRGWQQAGAAPSLARVHSRSRDADTIVQPATASERVLVDLWKELFGFSDISVEDDFFALGGDSLSGIRLMSMIKDATGRKLPINALLHEPTIRALAAQLDGDDGAVPWSPLVPIATAGNKTPVFCVPGTGGSVVYLRDLALALGDHGRPCFGFQAAGLDGRVAPLDSVEALAASNVAALLEWQPEGPYLLAGHSFGSWVALEMAHQLMQGGREVAMVAILDTAAPGERDVSAASVRTDTQWLLVVATMLSQLYGRRVDLTPASLEGLDWPAQLERFAQALIDGGVLPPKADRDEIRGLVNVYKAQAQMRYQPAAGHPAVDLVLLRAAEALADFVDGIPASMKDDETWGWRDYARGAAHIEIVPGDHLSMMTPPHCRAVAAALDRLAALREAAGIAAAGNRS